MSAIVRQGEGAVEQADALAEAFTVAKMADAGEAGDPDHHNDGLWYVATCRACEREWEVRSLVIGTPAFKKGDREALLAHSRAHDVKPTLRRRK